MGIQKYKVAGIQLRERATAERDKEISKTIDKAGKIVEDSKQLVGASAKLVNRSRKKRREQIGKGVASKQLE